MKKLPWLKTGWAVTFLSLLMGLYVVAYYSMVTVDRQFYPMIESFAGVAASSSVGIPRYRIEGRAVVAFFKPMHDIDRRLWPDRWRWLIHESP